MNQAKAKAILAAADYLRQNGLYIMDDDTAEKVAALKFKPGMGLEAIENEYATTLYEIMDDYANSDRPITSFRNRYYRAANDAMNLAVSAGWTDGGANGPIPSELQDWVNERIAQERDFIGGMFADLREMRPTATPDEMASFVNARAEGYTASLEGVYLQGKAYALGERPGVWRLGATEEHCSTCANLDGKTKPLRWYVDNGYIPRQAGSRTLECRGFHCDCGVYDPDTGEQLL